MAARQPKLPLPEYTTVMGVPFRVELTTLEEGVSGETNGELRIIKISQALDSRRQWTTLRHERFHAVFHVIGYANESVHEIEEMLVQSLEHDDEQFMLAHGDAYLRALEAQK